MGPSFMGPDAELKSFFLRRFFELYSQEHPSLLGLFRNQGDPRNTCPLERTEFSWVGRGRNAPSFMEARWPCNFWDLDKSLMKVR